MNGHCGCVELVEYFSFDYLHVTFGVRLKKLVFLVARRGAHATVTPPNPKAVAPYLRRHPFLPWKQRREEKLGHVFVDPHRSSPRTGWDFSPLSVFPISMAFPRCSCWCRLVWCCASRLDARKKGEMEWNCHSCRHCNTPGVCTVFN